MKDKPQHLDSLPTFHFDVDESLAGWNMPAREWLTKNDKQWTVIASGCAIFNSDEKVLVIQRASHDSLPNRWEIPGGAVEEADPTIFYGGARELWEETGLVAVRFSHIITEGPEKEPGQVFANSTNTKIICRFCFAMEVESCETVTLDPNEHQSFTWATEEEIRGNKIGRSEHPITNERMRALILEAFRLRKSRIEI